MFPYCDRDLTPEMLKLRKKMDIKLQELKDHARVAAAGISGKATDRIDCGAWIDYREGRPVLLKRNKAHTRGTDPRGLVQEWIWQPFDCSKPEIGEFVIKAKQGREDEINTCIACNQACLDHTFLGKMNTCLVNPRACYETQLNYLPTVTVKKVAVVGAGPAGLSIATIAALRGHDVTLFEASAEVGGQFNYAKKVPGKEEFHETLRYYKKQIELHRVKLILNKKVTAQELLEIGFDEIVVACGVLPRDLDLPGIEHSKVLSYQEVFLGAKVGKTVAIIGAGGIGFDVAEYITHNEHETPTSLDVPSFMKEWGIDMSLKARGGVEDIQPEFSKSDKQVYLLQRKASKVGAGLGKTTGWIHRTNLKKKEVEMLSDVSYLKIDDEGLHTLIKGQPHLFNIETIVICAGQTSQRSLYDELNTQVATLSTAPNVHLIGGAFEAGELDAKRAIRQGAELAAKL